jgi:hypothetical protein
MKVRDIMTDDNNETVKRLLWSLDGHTYGRERADQTALGHRRHGADAGERKAPSRPPPFAPNGADERARAVDHSSGKERRVR